MARVSDLRLAAWLNQMADAYDAGISPANALALSNGLPRDLSEGLGGVFEAGGNWSAAMERLPLPFSRAEEAVIRAAEQSGGLPRAFRRLATAREEGAKVARRMKLALLYPLFLIHFAALVFSVSYVVEGRYEAFAISVGMVLVPVWSLAIFGLLLFRYSPSTVRTASRYLPLFSSYRKNWDMGVLCDVLGTSLRAGVRIDAAWSVAVDAADNPRLARLGAAVQRAIKEGTPASAGIEESGVKVSKSFLQLYRSGESSGTLEQNLEAAAERYRTDAKNSVFLASMLYPKLILVAIFGYAGYKIILFFKDYYEDLMKIAV